MHRILYLSACLALQPSLGVSLSHRKKLKNLFRKGKQDDKGTLEGAGPHSDDDTQGEGQPEAPMAIKVRSVLQGLWLWQ